MSIIYSALLPMIFSFSLFSMESNESIYDSCQAGDLVKVKRLVKIDPTIVNVRSETGAAPLHYACANDKFNIAKYLLKNKADVNAIEKNDSIIDSYTPLDYAVLSHSKKTIKLLLKYNADVNIRDQMGRSALDLAKEIKNEQAIKILLNNTAQ
jgi:ankyrin repeat protein